MEPFTSTSSCKSAFQMQRNVDFLLVFKIPLREPNGDGFCDVVN